MLVEPCRWDTRLAVCVFTSAHDSECVMGDACPDGLSSTPQTRSMTIASAAGDAGLHVRQQTSSQHAVMPPETSCTHLLAGAWLRRTPIMAAACHAYTQPGRAITEELAGHRLHASSSWVAAFDMREPFPLRRCEPIEAVATA
jgi:hypothetical protein